MKMKKAPAAASLAVLVAASFASAKPNPKPDWVDGSSMEYPREKYLVGIGMADDRQTAEDRARAEISKIFSTVVTVNTADTMKGTDGGKAGDNSFSQSVSETVQTASQKALKDVNVVEDWQDEATRQYYALAVLDREKAATGIKDKVADIDKQAQKYNGDLAQATEKLARVKAAMKLLALFKARQSLNDELRVVSDSGKGVDNPIDEASVRPEAAKALAQLDVNVSLSGADSKQVQTGLIQGLSSFGIQATSKGEGKADIILEGAIDVKPMQGDGSAWRWARSNITVTLRDGATEKTFLQFDASDKESSADYDEAVRRTQVALAKQVSAKVQDAITSYFENQ